MTSWPALGQDNITENPMATLLMQLSLAVGSVGIVWLLAKKIQESRRIYHFHEER